jgi:hypothetical protein
MLPHLRSDWEPIFHVSAQRLTNLRDTLWYPRLYCRLGGDLKIVSGHVGISPRC